VFDGLPEALYVPSEPAVTSKDGAWRLTSDASEMLRTRYWRHGDVVVSPPPVRLPSYCDREELACSSISAMWLS